MYIYWKHGHIFILTVDEIDEEMKKVAEIEWVESFDVYSEPLLGVLTEYEEPEQKKTNKLICT